MAMRIFASILLALATCAHADQIDDENWAKILTRLSPKERAYMECHFRDSPVHNGMTQREVVKTCWGKPVRRERRMTRRGGAEQQ
jgi:hypothetical protein